MPNKMTDEEEFSLTGGGRKYKPKNIVKDPLLHPYHIKIEGEHAYTVHKDRAIFGYFTSFGNCLKRIALLKINLVEDDTERTLEEYLTDYYKHLENFNKGITI